jgi:hypothetical protein
VPFALSISDFLPGSLDWSRGDNIQTVTQSKTFPWVHRRFAAGTPQAGIQPKVLNPGATLVKADVTFGFTFASGA